MQKYDPKKIEKRWQKYWEKNKTFEVKEDQKKQKFYSLIEFPYPSGAGLHVGHPRPFTAMDVISRKKRMEGFNVLYPIGFDAFGLPTENYAIKTGRPPADVTKENIATFTRQLKSLGYSFDWSRAVDTTDPKYYKWTQWIFLQFFKHGLAYKKNQPINWCPKDKIGLANEEVVNGCCERCGTPVEKRDKEQWMLAITKYADKLLEGLKEVDYIPQARTQQENWIGRSEGALVRFGLQTTDHRPQPPGIKSRAVVRSQSTVDHVEVFTTRPDTIFGATFIAVSPELAKKWLDLGWQPARRRGGTDDKVKKYVTETLARKKSSRAEEPEKTGIDAGITAVNPVNNEETPVWITNYVMGDVGTGAIMGVPAHDERDWEFAKKYNLPIKHVVIPRRVDHKNPHVPGKEIVFRNAVIAIVKNLRTGKTLCLKWKKQPWTTFVMGGIEAGEDSVKAARREVEEETGYKNLKLVRVLGEPTHSEFFAAHKGVNRIAHTRSVLFELENEEKAEIAQEEKDAYDIVWLADEDIIPEKMTHIETDIILARIKNGEQAFTEEGILINSGKFDRMNSEEAKKKITEEVGGKWTATYKLRDWVFSRQRYWGEPIPLVFCQSCAKNQESRIKNQELSEGEKLNPGWIPLSEKDLPLKLPKVKKYEPTDTGESPLAAMEKWVKTKCPRCGGSARRETDTMPNWAGSSWYFLRYCDPHNDKQFAAPDKLKYWLGSTKLGAKPGEGGVDWYNGGMEHTVLHLLYSRFWNEFLFDIGLVPTREPYKKRTSHGLILGPDGEKMSKSRGNVVNPDEMVEKFGTDAFRMYIMFMGPFDQPVQWDTNGLTGVRRFLERVWALQEKINDEKPNYRLTHNGVDDLATIKSILHQTIKKVSDDIEKMRFNTAVAQLMILVSEMSHPAVRVSSEDYQVLIKLLSPFAPHIAEELWEKFGDDAPLAFSVWPKFDQALAKESTMTLAIQINGKVRDEISVAAEANEEEVKKLALASDKVQKWLGGKEPKKIIYVKGKLVSIVV